MSLDTATLFTVATCVAGLLGIFIIGIWVRERSTRALGWWGTAYLMGGVAVGLWSAQTTSPIPNALLFVACGMVWNGARLFHGRSLSPGGLFAGAIVWIAAMQFPGFAASEHWRIILSSLVAASYTFLTASGLQGRRTSDRLRLAPFMPLLHGIVFLLPIPATLLTPPGVSSDGWFALFALQTLLYAVGAAFMLVSMAQERVALGHKAEAMTDPLTGLLNRRGIFDCGEQLMTGAAQKSAPVSVLVVDLDRFKSINDRFGHTVGDEVLRLFAKTARDNTRASDVLGRLGGDEFAVIVPGGPALAAMIGERLRAAFEAASDELSAQRVGATVSIGVASAPADIGLLLNRADAALYAAKANGRNRVELAADEMPAEPVPPARPKSIRGEALAHLNPV